MTAIAVDSKGGRSAPLHMQVVVTGSALDKNKTTVTYFSGLRNAILNADGSSSTRILIQARDAQGDPVSGLAALNQITFTQRLLPSRTAMAGGTWTGSLWNALSEILPAAYAATAPGAGVSLSAVKETSPGNYEVVVTAGFQPGEATLTPTLSGEVFPDLTVKLTPGGASTATSTLTASPASIVTDGTAASILTLTLTLKDASSNPLSGQTVTFSSTLADSVFSAITDNNDGTYTASLTGTRAGSASVTANVGGSAFAVSPVAVTLTGNAATAQIAAAALTVTADNAVADGAATNSVQAIVTDANGNPLSGQTVTFSATNGATLAATGTTAANGTVTATLTSTTAGVSQVSAAINGSSRTVSVTFVAGGAIADADFTAGTGAVANGTSTNALSATVKDAQGNPLSGVDVTFAVTTGAATPATQTVQTGANGIATATLVGQVAGNNQVTAKTGTHTTAAKTSTFIAPTFTGVSVNGNTFAVNDRFPSTGFTGAEFSLTVIGAASDYTWSSSAPSWAQVDSSGKVSFISKGNASPVTITATPNRGGTPLTYIFTVRSWFIIKSPADWTNASAWCTNQGLPQATRGELTKGPKIRAVGSLWSEWGGLNHYPSTSDSYAGWTSESDGHIASSHYVVLQSIGVDNIAPDSYQDGSAVCRQGL